MADEPQSPGYGLAAWVLTQKLLVELHIKGIFSSAEIIDLLEQQLQLLELVQMEADQAAVEALHRARELLESLRLGFSPEP